MKLKLRLPLAIVLEAIIDIIAIVGASLVIYGISQIYTPAAYICAGLMILMIPLVRFYRSMRSVNK